MSGVTPCYGMDAEPLLRGLLQRGDLRRGVKADVEVALADVERLRDLIGRLAVVLETACEAIESEWGVDAAYEERAMVDEARAVAEGER